MKYPKRIVGFVVLFLVVIVCGANCLHNTTRPSPEVTALMNKKIDDFHQKLIQNKFGDIYAESDSELKSKFSEQEFVDYLGKAREKFGSEIPKANINLQENLINILRRKWGKPVVQYAFNTIAEKPNYKSETFRWVIYSNDEIRLLSYDY